MSFAGEACDSRNEWAFLIAAPIWHVTTTSETSNVAGSGFGLPRAGRIVDLASPARGGITRANYPHFRDGSSRDVA